MSQFHLGLFPTIPAGFRPIHTPRRKDRRIARQWIDSVRDGEPCPELERLGRGRLADIVAFLDCCGGLVYIVLGRDGEGEHVRCGPDVDAVVRMACQGLGLSSPIDVPANPSPKRSRRIEGLLDRTYDAVYVMFDELMSRGDVDCIVMWQFEGDDVGTTFDYSPRVSHHAAREYVIWFLHDVLHVPFPECARLDEKWELAPGA